VMNIKDTICWNTRLRGVLLVRTNISETRDAPLFCSEVRGSRVLRNSVPLYQWPQSYIRERIILVLMIFLI